MPSKTTQEATISARTGGRPSGRANTRLKAGNAQKAPSRPQEEGNEKSTAVARAIGYARDVVSGRIRMGEKVTRSCRRFIDDLARAGQLADDWETAAAEDAVLPPPEAGETLRNGGDRPLVPHTRDCGDSPPVPGSDGQSSGARDDGWPWVFNLKKAARPVDFIEKFLKPTKGDYDRMTLMGWQCFIECNLYGWVHRDTGLRRFREALILVGSGNGKSTMVAGNATFAACKDEERGADVYLLANSKDQAGIVFEECKAQIDNSPALASRFRTLRDGVYYDKMNARIRHRSSDSKRLDGLNPHLAIFDEIHEYRDFKLINIIARKTIKRTQPLILYITTMGNVIDGPLAYYYDQFTDAMNGTLKADVADRMFAYIAELDAADDIEDTRNWIKANPGLGYTLKLEELIEKWEKNKLIPSERADFICKQLDIMVNADDMAFVQPEVVRRNRDTISLESLLGRRCYGGFDLSNREDFTAAALEFPLDDGRSYVLLHSWVPQRKVEMDQEKIDYYGLAMQGYLTIVPGEYIQQEDVYRWFAEMSWKYEIVTIGYDPANATRLRQMLEVGGRIDGKSVQAFDCQVVRQGPITLNDPMKDIKEMLLAGRVVSNQDPMLTWYTDNVRISGERRHLDKENWMPMKRNKFRKIDGFMAWLDAHCVRMQKAPAGQTYTVPNIRVVELGRRR